MLDIILPSLPTVPSSGKWTQLTACIDFYTVANLYGVLALLTGPAFQQLKVDNAEFMRGLRGEGLGEDKTGEGPSWQRLSGTRYARLERRVSDQEFNCTILIMSFVLEPLRCLTVEFMHYSNQVIGAQS